MPDPSVSPAATIRLADNGIAELRAAVANDTMPCLFMDDARGLLEAWDALLAVGERDRQHIERLTEALTHYATEDHWTLETWGDETDADTWAYDGGERYPWVIARAVLAEKEHVPDEPIAGVVERVSAYTGGQP